MLLLGIDTATAQVGCAVGGPDGVLASFHAAHDRRHVETLAPAIEFVCHHAGVDLDEIAAVAVDIGPGLFSGLRVGVAAAKAIAQALRVQAVGVSSLDLLAFPVRHSNRLIVPAIDARRRELFYAFYRQVPGGVQRLSPYQIGSPADLVSDLVAKGEDCFFVGDGPLRYPEIVEQVAGEYGGQFTAHPSASALIELAAPVVMREEFVQPWDLSPMYLRKTDAEINWEHHRAAAAGARNSTGTATGGVGAPRSARRRGGGPAGA